MVRGWLKAGVVEDGHFAPTEEGAPQGGVISPLLLNIVLHGMETAAGVRYRKRQGGRTETAYDCPVLVRYADDLTAFCHSRQQAEQVKQRLAEWLEPRGLAFNEDKTRIVHVNRGGCDFLGFNIRRYHNKLPLIKPSPGAVKRIRKRLRTEMLALRGGNAASVLKKLTPIIRGWSAYYRTQVSSEIFSDLDDYMWKLLYKWAKHSHPKKSRWWIIDHYFGRFNKSRNNRWVFGDLPTGAYLPKFAWTKIVRHTMVLGTASPDDPNLVQYWTNRRRKQPPPPLGALVLGLLKTQKCRCVLCGDMLLHTDEQPQSPHEWEQWLRTTRMAIRKQHIVTGVGGQDNQRLIHASCQRRTDGTAHQHD
jgi:RNA-directed DNA polymerase